MPTIKIRDEDALEYHEKPRPGKLEVIPTKKCLTQRDLSLAYTPGVAVPCRHIEKSPTDAYRYTNKGNLVAVISNGTAVLGLGDIGPLAGKPVMEGKGVLFNRFAGIDVFDIEVSSKEVDEFCHAVSLIAPTFGGINLEDIKAPECFDIETRLSEELDIPVFHDDQHGTAIIATAGLINALELQNKKAEDITCVILGAGAAGIAIHTMFEALGVKAENILLVDRRGVIYKGRQDGMNPYKEKIAVDTDARTLADAMNGADVFVGVSGPNLVTEDMVKTMADKPILFALSNPDPEIEYDVVRDLRPDAIMATGRSDFPNQVNNVLGFPFIFRGALDVRSSAINTEMKVAASEALAKLARTDVPEEVLQAYGVTEMSYGPDYILPKPLDPRVLLWVAPAVAEAAIESGVGDREVWPGREAYAHRLESMLGPSRRVMRMITEKARRVRGKIVLPDGRELTVMRAAQHMVDVGIAEPILLGNEEQIQREAAEHSIDLNGVEIINPATYPDLDNLADRLYQLRKRRGVAPRDARRMIHRNSVFGLMMVDMGLADGLVGGIGRPYPESIRPVLELIGPREGVKRVTAVEAIILPDQLYVLTDTSLNIEPDAETLAEMAILGAEAAKQLFDLDPKVAMLSFSDFGSVNHPLARKVAKAVEMLHEQVPDLVVDGEMQADVAVSERVAGVFPHSQIQGDANVLVCPDLQSGNITYRLLARIAKAETVGPITCGLRKPVNMISHSASVAEIVRASTITVLQSKWAEQEMHSLQHRS
jgi:malate dehydrogenase (oxaloacetate-decarboxylating)(NADP+)